MKQCHERLPLDSRWRTLSYDFHTCYAVAGRRRARVRSADTWRRDCTAPYVERPAAVSAKLSEWKVELSQPSITAGVVTFTVTNAGSVPHAFEVEGQGIEKETEVIQPGASA